MRLVPLKEFCKMYQPPTISTKEMIPDGDYVVYGANGPIGRYNKFNHEEPQLLVTCRGATCGAVNMSEPFAWINGNAMVIQPNLKLATLEYMRYAFLGGIDVSSSITGSAQPQITRTTLEVIKVPLPSLEKQHEIVEKLDRAFADIDLLEENFASLECLINEFDTSILGRVLNSNNREIEGHRNSTLGEVTELIARGVSPTYLDSANTVVLNQRCIRNGRIDLDFSRRHDETAKRVQETKLLQSGDGLINSTGVGTLGRTALFDHPGVGEFTVDSHVTIVRPKSAILDSDYFGLVLRALENVFVSLSTGTSGQTELPREAIKDTGITYPKNLDDQKDFFAYYNSLNLSVIEFRKVLINKRVLAETLRASLLSSAFTESEEVA